MRNKNVQLDLTLLQNELKSDDARCSTHVQTCLATKQVVELCEYQLVIWQNWAEVTPPGHAIHLLQGNFALGR